MHNILIVDDESGIRQSLKGVLEDEGYKASAADSGEACLDALRKRYPEWTASRPCKRSTTSRTRPR